MSTAPKTSDNTYKDSKNRKPRKSVRAVYGKRSMGEKIYQKGKFWVESEKVKGWWMGKVEKRRMDWGKHKEVKLVHEVKMEVYSRDEGNGNQSQYCEWEWESIGIDCMGVGNGGNQKTHSRSSLVPIGVSLGEFFVSSTESQLQHSWRMNTTANGTSRVEGVGDLRPLVSCSSMRCSHNCIFRTVSRKAA